MKPIRMPYLRPATLNVNGAWPTTDAGAYSKVWLCDLGNGSGQLVYTPAAGYEPNWFQRWMLRLFFGFIWYRRDA